MLQELADKVNPFSETDAETIRRTISLWCVPGGVYEVRVPGSKDGVISGYYHDFDKLATRIYDLSESGLAGAVYLTLNPVQPNLLSRSPNRTTIAGRGQTFGDTDVPHLYRLLVDCDCTAPARGKNRSSSPDEHLATVLKAGVIRQCLRERGFPEPVYASSGNGSHLLYGIDLPNTPENVEILKAFLAAVRKLFAVPDVTPDTTVFNPSRICKVYGTWVRKGDWEPKTEDQPERPHRVAAIIDAPESLTPVPVELLLKVIEDAQVVVEQPKKRLSRDDPNYELLCEYARLNRPKGTGRGWSFEHAFAWMDYHDLERTEPFDEGHRWVMFVRCPWEDEHSSTVNSPTSATALFINKEPDGSAGAIGFCCKHDHCKDRKWQDVREFFEEQDDGFAYDAPATKERFERWDREGRFPGDKVPPATEPLPEPPVEKPGTEQPQSQTYETKDAFWRHLEYDGVPVIKAVNVEGTDWRQYLSLCPRCKYPGIFVLNLKTHGKTYECGCTKGKWIDGIKIHLTEQERKEQAAIRPLPLFDAWRLAASEPKEVFVENLWEFGNFNMVFAASTAGKSTVIRECIAASVCGQRFLRRFRLKSHNVHHLYYDGEGGIDTLPELVRLVLDEPSRTYADTFDSDPEEVARITMEEITRREEQMLQDERLLALQENVSIMPPVILTPERLRQDVENLRQEIGDRKKIVVYIDTIRTYHSGGNINGLQYDENDNVGITALTRGYSAVARGLGLCIVGSHHTRRDGIGHAGAEAWRGGVSGIAYITVNADKTRSLIVERQSRGRPSTMPEQIIKMTANHRLVCMGSKSEIVDQITVERFRMLWTGQPDEQMTKTMMTNNGISECELDAFIKDAIDRGLIQGTQRSNERGKPYYYGPTDRGRTIVNQARYDTPELPEVTPTVSDEEFFARKEREKIAKQG